MDALFRRGFTALHESRESWERFRDGILMPKIKQGVKGGFTVQPQETVFPVHLLLQEQSVPTRR